MIFIWILFFSAFAISAIAGWFSIAGLIAIFPGAPIAIGLMGAALELGKLVSASWLYRSWKKAPRLMRIYFTLAVCVLSFITSIGIFGYLTRSHVEGSQNLGANNDQVALIDGELNAQREVIAGAKINLQQLDRVVNALPPERAVTVRRSQRAERELIATTIKDGNAKLLELEKSRAILNIDTRKLETEVGPIKYVAQLVYGADDTQTLDRAIRILTLLLVFVFDPLAILLVVAGNMQLEKNRRDTPYTKIPPINKTAKIDELLEPFKMVTRPKKGA